MSNMLHILGARLAQVTGKDERTCRGMVRFAVEDGAEHLRQTREHTIWQAYLDSMSFGDWEAALQAESLSRRLRNVGVEDPVTAIAELRNTLVDRQSLLTMSAR